MSRPPHTRLSGDAKQALFASLKTGKPSEATSRKRAADRSAPARSYDTSFESLPGFREAQVQRAAAELFGVGNPFYRLHTTQAGARSEIDGKPVLNFASYDYLGLNAETEVQEAARAAISEWGTSVSASRITAGERPFHRELEAELAAVYEAEAALVFVSGHATNISVISQLVGPGDLILHDALIHNSAVVGAQLSGAQRRTFPHNDMDALEAMLRAERDSFGRVLVVTEGLFSMDGDSPDLARLIELKTRFGAWLMVDDAHGLGVLGRTGRGLAEHCGVDPGGVDIWMGTLSKTLASCGGYIAGKAALVDYLKFTAPGFVYSVGIPAPAATASLAALRMMRQEPERAARLQENGRLFLELACAAGLDTGTSNGHCVVPVILGDSLRTAVLAQRLLARGINAVPIIPPAVPEKAARLRFFISSTHRPEDLRQAVSGVREEVDGLDRDGISLANLGALAGGLAGR
ncbi:8-amino-7-oxononanoate synthase [Faunimonas pinastri]|uniref:8-amino-7-oxononanoate synthase n=1 Tax=Faunimonas pinastri TaxID=1855383 RepID=A0A1H9FGM0_9HYPH|nr:aminotransferase class I/II-fold pyridoxal phosphate-dependent enzyme [Faunimonas pinastri]SEQ36468.1 8-amino-7-oxononanoate synthase [Faunimonas pinastri]